MNNYAVGGVILIVLASLNTALRFYLWRSGRVSRNKALPGLLAAVGFVALGIVYAARLEQRWPAAPAVALGIAAAGMLIGILVGRIEGTMSKSK